jgi:CheY-like chemotaxis protein
VGAAIAELEPLLRRLLGPYLRVELRQGRGLGLVRAEPAQLQQLLLNLALNARDAMPGGGRLLIEAQDVEIAGGSAPPAPPGRYVMLVVSDDGVGMDATTRERAFEPFFTTKPVGAGSGLGLVTVERVATQAGGTIRVDSQPGRGTTVRVYLPWAAEPGEQPPLDAASPAPPGRETVLVADGSPEAREVTCQLLAALGYTVLQASSAEEALRLARERREALDLVLADAAMPGVGGGHLGEQLAGARPRARLLLMSGAAGADLAKPFSQEQLARAVREALDRGRD